MKYFLVSGKVHAYESDGSQDAWIPDVAQPITEAEAMEILNPPTPEPTQFELDQIRYRRRADVQSDLLAWMAADNMSRVRSGAWSVEDLTGLLADPAIVEANAYMQTLSYELAAAAIEAATTPLLTPEIKAAWTAKLAEHYYI